MLTTNDNLVLKVPVTDGNSTVWRTVNMELWIPYAFITHSYMQDFVWHSQTSIYWVEEDIINFFRTFRNNRFRKIFDVSLLVPSDNGNNPLERQWVKIEEVWVYQIPGSLGLLPFYITEDKKTIGKINEMKEIKSENASLLYGVTKRLRTKG